MLDLSSVLGTVLGLLAIVGGQLLEGGAIGQITQFTSGLIVIGGTLGAMFLSFPVEELKRAFELVPSIYFKETSDSSKLISEIIRIAGVARKEGLLAIESHRGSIEDPLFRRAIKYVIDGFEPATVREIIDAEIDFEAEQGESAAKVFESAGGYSPTIGILGAVLGLIHVMTLLSEPSRIGEGIAVAFVATLYGVALANLILLPWASKLKRRAARRTLQMEVVKAGIIGIQEGLNPHFLQEKLEVLAGQRPLPPTPLSPPVGANAG